MKSLVFLFIALFQVSAFACEVSFLLKTTGAKGGAPEMMVVESQRLSRSDFKAIKKINIQQNDNEGDLDVFAVGVAVAPTVSYEIYINGNFAQSGAVSAAADGNFYINTNVKDACELY